MHLTVVNVISVVPNESLETFLIDHLSGRIGELLEICFEVSSFLVVPHEGFLQFIQFVQVDILLLVLRFNVSNLRVQLGIVVEWRWWQMHNIWVQLFKILFILELLVLELMMMSFLCVPVQCIDVELAGVCFLVVGIVVVFWEVAHESDGVGLGCSVVILRSGLVKTFLEDVSGLVFVCYWGCSVGVAHVVGSLAACFHYCVKVISFIFGIKFICLFYS